MARNKLKHCVKHLVNIFFESTVGIMRDLCGKGFGRNTKVNKNCVGTMPFKINVTTPEVNCDRCESDFEGRLYFGVVHKQR